MLQDLTPIILTTSIVLSILIIIAVVLVRQRFGERRIYKPKGPLLLSQGEKRFFDALSNVIDGNMYICPKVRIADIVEVDLPKESKDFWIKFNQISQKHVDFLICDKQNFSPLFVIELDGRSHYSKDSFQRDEFVDSVFKSANIAIIHIKVATYYDYAVLKATILRAINQNSDKNNSPNLTP